MDRNEFLTRVADYNALLDVARDDWQTRLVLADMLEEFGDEEEKYLAPGYRALAALRFVPHVLHTQAVYVCRMGTGSSMPREVRDYNVRTNWDSLNARGYLPLEWYLMICSMTDTDQWAYVVGAQSREACEDNAALAFRLLMPKLRSEILALLNPDKPVRGAKGEKPPNVNPRRRPRL